MKHFILLLIVISVLLMLLYGVGGIMLIVFFLMLNITGVFFISCISSIITGLLMILWLVSIDFKEIGDLFK